MKNRGFTISEVMVVALISAVIFGVMFGIFIVGRNAWAKASMRTELQDMARMAMDKMVRELSLSSPTQIQFDNCDGEGVCQSITFKVPVATGDPPTIYRGEDIKWGAEGQEGLEIQYWVGDNNHLVRYLNTPITGACCTLLGPCNIITQQACESTGGDYQGDNIPCEPDPCGGGGPECFLAGTPILMSDGSIKPIEQIKIGDEVRAFDEETKKFVKDKVSKVFAHKSKGYLVINNQLKVTPNHPVYSNGKWIEVGKLNIGDVLLNSQGEPVPITEIKKANEKVATYNFEVNPFHSYIAAGFVVHNKDPLPPPIMGPPGDPGNPPYGFLKSLISGALAYAEDITILANNISWVNFVGTPPAPGFPNIVKITISAQRHSILGENIEIILNSTVYIRN